MRRDKLLQSAFRTVVNYGLRAALREESRALAYCSEHPDDHSVLVTQTAYGLRAGRSPDVKAVIWQQAVPEKDQAKITSQMTAQQRDNLEATYNYTRTDSLLYTKKQGIYSGPYGKAPMKQDMNKVMFKNMNRIVREFAIASNANEMKGWMHGYDHNTQMAHIDERGAKNRLHVAIIGEGLEWFAGDFKNVDLADMMRWREPADYPSHVLSHITAAGDAVWFKGSKSNYCPPKNCTAGLVHKGPKTPEGTIIPLRLAGIFEPKDIQPS